MLRFRFMDERLRFEQNLRANAKNYDLELTAENITQLGDYYTLLSRWNERLHLVAPCSPEDFATRHVLESLLLLKHLPANAKVADIGSGGGLPIIPCLSVRADLEVTMIESSQKKAVFLREALRAIDRNATIIARRFEDTSPPAVSFITSRALDQFMGKVSALIEWAPKGSTLLLFGGEELLTNTERLLIPGSEKRFLFSHKKHK